MHVVGLSRIVTKTFYQSLFGVYIDYTYFVCYELSSLLFVIFSLLSCQHEIYYFILFYSIQVYRREVTLGSHSLRKALGIAYELFILVKEEVLEKTGLAL